MYKRLTRIFFPRTKHHRPGEGISILFPFEPRGGIRQENYEWLWEFYRNALPGAQIVTEGYPHLPFNKSAAVNAAAERATGDILAILDADALIDPDVLLVAAAEIRAAKARGRMLWIMPYRRLYRLTVTWSRHVLDGPVTYGVPCWLDEPLDADMYENRGGGSMHGHMFGAMCQVVPRDAFDLVGGWDERFAGWGGEDVSHARALDTLWGRHRSLNAPIYHLWHPTAPSSAQWSVSRSWEGQDLDDHCNEHLANRYYDAYMDWEKMRRLTWETAL